MLRELRIRNFKCWKDTGSIRMAPITLLFGTNSSGKSSIGQFLMMLKQTVESSDRKAVFFPGGKNSAVHLGSYQEMVFHRDFKNNIGFDYEWDLSENLQVKDPLHKKSYTGDCISFAAEVGLKDNGSEDKNENSLMLEHFDYKMMGEKEKMVLSIGMSRQSLKKSQYEVKSEGYDLTRKQGRPWNPGPPVRFYGFPDEVVAYYQNADFVQSLNLQHEKLFRSICYLGPLRSKAERLYSWTGNEPENVGYSGENTIAAILAAKKRKIGLGYRRPVQPFEKIIASKLKEMGLIEDFKVKSISAERHEYEVKLRTKGSPDWVDLPDVGFGISQVLPVLVQCFYAPKNSIIIMEQPEIHLHPSAQSALADVMIDAIKAREDSEDRNIQLVVETHSEHFLRRLQRRIAESEANGILSRADVSAYHSDVTAMPAKLEELKIDMFGIIENWPENFFGDEMMDILEQSKSAMRARSKHKASGEDVIDG